MGSKKQIIAIVLLSVLLGGGAVGYSWHMGQTRASTFPGAGYVHIADPEQDAKQLAFQGGAVWRRGLSNTVSFTDTQGVQQKISALSFAHFDDSSLAALSRGVVVDLNDLDTAQVTNHYSLAPTMTFANTGSGYTLQNSAVELTLNDFLWKISEDKYMLVSKGMELSLSEENARPVGDYLEITYVDEGVIQLQTAENVWQTVSDVCSVTLDNGDVVDLALRNVQDGEGEVLMDFSKMVVDSESNIEATPLTEELRNVKESVIPHFEITARDGEDGEDGAIGAPGESGAPGEAGVAGDPGENGESGEDGKQGAPGEAGQNGAAGASGTNGAAGAPGKAGEAGEDGKEPPVAINAEVLSLPEFTLKGWMPTATGCEGAIMVQDKGRMLVPNGTKDKSGEALNAAVYVVDALTGQKAGTNSFAADTYTFNTTAGEGYKFSFNGLAPDREYMLVVEAPLNTGTGSKGAYVRTFISKSFFTDSVGVYLEAEPSGEEPSGEGGALAPTVNLSVHTQEYAAGSVTGATVYLFASESAAASATLSSLKEEGNPNILCQMEAVLDETGESEVITLRGNSESLAFNTTYYARVIAKVNETDMLPAQVLPLTTLKRRPTMRAPIITADRNNWGFELTPEGVIDPDNGITGYEWEIIPEDTLNSPAQWDSVKKTVRVEQANSVTVPLDNTVLKPEEKYVARLVVHFNDNEKSYSIASDWSNAAKVAGGELPLVTFTPTGASSPDREDVTRLNTDAGYYDQIVGFISVIATNKSARLMLGGEHTAKVTVYSAGYYRKELPVYDRNDVPDSVSGANSPYLVGTTETGGTVKIDVPEGALKDLQIDNGTGAEPTPKSVNGLFPDMAYRLIVSGDLSNSTNSSYRIEKDVTVGACVVETSELQWTGVSLVYNENAAADRDTLAQAKLRLFDAKPMDESGAELKVEDDLLDRQIQTLSTVTIRALRTASSTEDYGSPLVLTSENYEARLRALGMGDDVLKKEGGGTKSLGEVMAAGLPLRAEMFGPAFEVSIQNASAAFIQVKTAQDYTCLVQNRQSWSYREENGVKLYPDVNSFPLAPSARTESGMTRAEASNSSRDEITFTIPLAPTPEEIPEPEEGFIREDLSDTDNDRVNDQGMLEPDFANGAHMARYITFYAFDRPDFHEVDYTGTTGGWQFDPKFDPTWKGDKSDAGYLRLWEYLTPVTAVKSDGKGAWLARLRVPVPASNLIPKVKFIPMTALEYYTRLVEQTGREVNENTLNEAGMDKHKLALEHLRNGVVTVSPYEPGSNTWYMFYPDDSTQPASGHQFVFAWTLEWEQPNPGGDPIKKYYPFEMTEFANASKTWQTWKSLIPHSHVKDSPHPAPEVYAMPWKQDTRDANRTIEWDLTINDPAGAVVSAGTSADGKRQTYLYEIGGATDSNGTRLNKTAVTGSGAQPTLVNLQEQSRARKTSVERTNYQTWMETVTRDTATIYVTPSTATKPKSNHTVGLLLQRYTNRYLKDVTKPFNPGGGSGFGSAPGDVNVYTDATWLASTINNHNPIPYYSSAFSFNFDETESDTGTNPGSDINLIIDPGNIADLSKELNQFDITVTGNNLDRINGVRLTFGDDSTGKVVLDKYINGYAVDRVSETKATEGTTRRLNFRVHIDKELNDPKVAGKTVPFSAEVLYENGKEGYFYLEEGVAKNTAGSQVTYDRYPLGLRENANNTASGAWGWKYLRYTGGEYAIRESWNQNDTHPLKMGSMFKLVWQDAKGNQTTVNNGHKGWPYGIGLIPTRAGYMADLTAKVKADGVKITTLEITNGVASGGWTRSGKVAIPRVLATSAIGNVTGDALHDGTIVVPGTKPYIIYDKNESSGYANFVKVVFQVNMALQNNLYFTLEQNVAPEGSPAVYHMLTYGGEKWNPLPENAVARLPDSNETTVNNYVTSTNQTDIFFQFTGYNRANQWREFTASILEARTGYRIRAYRWNDAARRYELLKETDDLGEPKEMNNFLELSTSLPPDPGITAIYTPITYKEKRLTVKGSLENVEKYYFTLELQKKTGEDQYEFVTYLNTFFNYAVGGTMIGSAENRFNVGQPGTQESDLGPIPGLFYSDTVTTANADGLIVDPSRPIHLEYGGEYKVVMRAYNQGEGPAYGQGKEDNDLLNNIENPREVEFTVPKEEDGVNLYREFKLTRDEYNKAKGEVVFSLTADKRSHLIWQDKLAPVIIWYDESEDKYYNITDEVLPENHIGGTVGFGNRDIKVSMNDPRYEKNDEFYCFVYGIMETGTNTSGLPDIADPSASRDYILGPEWTGWLNEYPLDGRIIAMLRTEGTAGQDVQAGGNTVGQRRLLADTSITHKGLDSHAGSVNVYWHPDNKDNKYDILVNLTDPVEPNAIQYVHWSITATYTEEGEDLNKSDSDSFARDLTSDSFTISPNFNFSDKVTNVSYQVTLYFTKTDDPDADPIGLTAGNQAWRVSDNRLSGVLAPNEQSPNLLSTVFRTIRDFFAAPFKREG